MNEILLVGGGGHCKSVIDVIELEGKFKIAGIIDKKENLGLSVMGYEIIGTDDDLPHLAKKYKYAFISIGQIKTAEIRIKMYAFLKEYGFILPVIVSPRAYTSKYSKMGEGTVIMHNAIVNANANIGKNCIINTSAIIEHDAVIGDFCHISTGAIINGGVIVGDYSFIGSSATTKQYTKIPERSFIKAGSVVK